MNLKTIYKDYPQSHAFWAVVFSMIGAAVAHFGLSAPFGTWWIWLAGAAFYGPREVIQWREKGYWDMKGFVWGVVPSFALAFVAATA